MKTNKSGVRKVKGWAVIQNGKIVEEKGYSHTFEVDRKIPIQSIFQVAPLKREAEAYKKKWLGNSAKDMKIVPCTITYHVPNKSKGD